MQSLRRLDTWLRQHASEVHDVFTLQDFRSFFPDLSNLAFKTLFSRAVEGHYLIRICRGLYTHKDTNFSNGLLLFHAASHLRSNVFNYISLETVLSDAGVISQIPTNLVTIMSSGRSNTIHCERFGTIEFIHTNQKPTDIMEQLTYDKNCRLWRASIALALRDMKKTRRNCDLINWEIVHELI